MFISQALVVQFALIMLLFAIKHFLADYCLQNKYTNRKNNKKFWIKPLLTHGAIHGMLTALVLQLFCPFWIAMAIGVADFVTHSAIDAMKSRWLKYPPFTKKFWVAHGADQFAHELTYLAITFCVVLGYCQ